MFLRQVVRICFMFPYVCLLLSGCQLFHREESLYPHSVISVFDVSFDKIDPRNVDFPGGRGEDQMILYTPNFGTATGANQWGTEAVVIGGIVHKVGGNNSDIPTNGFVISGHGKAARWIVDNLYPGVEVTIEGQKIICSVTDATCLYQSSSLIEEADALDASHIEWDPLVSMNDLRSLKSQSEKWGARSRKAARSGDSRQSVLFAKKALDSAFEYYYKSQRSRQIELRACWHRLQEKSPQELERTIKKIAEAGFNGVCPETIYWGYAIYPDAHPALPQNPAFLGWDPLEELCRLAHKYKIKVIPWVEVFFIGFDQSPLKKEKSGWLAFSRNGDYPSTLEKGYYYFCPSRREVRQFWLEVYEKMIRKYDIDGLQLDYIRYPRSLPWEQGYCYCGRCRELFFNKFEVDPALIDPVKNPEVWEKWNQFRSDQVTEFVRQVSVMLKEIRPDLRLSADVFPDRKEAVESKFQDWKLWLDKGYIEEVFTMSYTSDADQVNRESQGFMQDAPPQFRGYVGLGPYLGFPPKTLIDQIRAVQETGAQGFCLFSLEYLSDDHLKALKQGPFRLPAYVP
ncbi:family 10 glycosylhydrolase [Candidatus Sumerlaeota bacterium]|nr:family 10 glycosylhydrolase [Candidatus Sumerlaeota bacterium]